MPNGEQPPERRKSEDLLNNIYVPLITSEFLEEVREKVNKNKPPLEIPDINNNNLRIVAEGEKRIIIEATEEIGNSFINTYNQIKNGYKICAELIDKLDEENRTLDTNLNFYIMGNQQGNKLLQDKNSQVIQLKAKNTNLQGEVDNLKYELGERDKQITELNKTIADHGLNEIKDIKTKTDNLLNLVNNVAPSHWKENITLTSTILLIPLTIYGLLKKMWKKDQDKQRAQELDEAVKLVKENIKKDRGE